MPPPQHVGNTKPIRCRASLRDAGSAISPNCVISRRIAPPGVTTRGQAVNCRRGLLRPKNIGRAMETPNSRRVNSRDKHFPSSPDEKARQVQ